MGAIERPQIVVVPADQIRRHRQQLEILTSQRSRLIGERYPIYAEADIHIQSRDVAHDLVIDDIFAALDDYIAREGAGRASTG